MQHARLDVRGVRKAFDGREILTDASLRLEPGQIMGLLGHNGAGKSTLINIATGLLRPDSGTVTVDGIDLLSRRESAVGAIGSAPQALGIYPSLSLQDNVRAFAGLHGLRGRSRNTRCAEVIESLGLTAFAHVRAQQLSGGQQRRLHLAMALTHSPRLLFLDEPTVGADVESRQQILNLVKRLATDGAAVLYTTHYLHELEHLSAEIALLNNGTVQQLGNVGAVVERFGESVVRVRIAQDCGQKDGWSREGEWLVKSTKDESPGVQLSALIAALGNTAGAITDVDFSPRTLESAYVQLLKDGSARVRRDSGANSVAS